MQHERAQSMWEGPLTGGERAPAGEGGAPEGGRGEEEGPRGGLPDLQSSPAFWLHTLVQSALGDINSPANYKA